MRVSYEEFIKNYQHLLSEYWKNISPQILEWKKEYEWPKGIKLEKAIEIRNSLENLINNDLNKFGCITKNVFDKVMKWGFGSPTKISEEKINAVTKRAFAKLRSNNISNSIKILTELEGIGISRASKVLALSNQENFGIYDSRAAHGLFDLTVNNKRLIRIPPGRVIAGDYLSDYSEAFEKYIYVLMFLHSNAQKDPTLSQNFKRIADIEIALFSRSRNKLKAPPIYKSPKYLSENRKLNISAIEEGDYYWTLGKGNKAKPFWARIMDDRISILTGENGKSSESLTSSEIKSCLLHFKKSDWFPLGNNITDLKPGGLGEYFKNDLHKSAKYASHFAAIWVNQKLLTCQHGDRSRVELKVLEKAKGTDDNPFSP